MEKDKVFQAVDVRSPIDPHAPSVLKPTLVITITGSAFVGWYFLVDSLCSRFLLSNVDQTKLIILVLSMPFLLVLVVLVVGKVVDRFVADDDSPVHVARHLAIGDEWFRVSYHLAYSFDLNFSFWGAALRGLPVPGLPLVSSSAPPAYLLSEDKLELRVLTKQINFMVSVKSLELDQLLVVTSQDIIVIPMRFETHVWQQILDLVRARFKVFYAFEPPPLLQPDDLVRLQFIGPQPPIF